VRDDYDDEFEALDEGPEGLIALLLAVLALWAIAVVVTWALR
jgi:hypothetical protein